MDENGDSIKLMEGQFVEGEMDGRWQWWMDPAHHAGHMMQGYAGHDGHEGHMAADDSQRVHPAPHKMAHYKMGVPHGTSLSWHPSGRTADSITYENGKLHGTCIWRHENGTIAAESEYSYGELVRPTARWDSLGQRIDSTP